MDGFVRRRAISRAGFFLEVAELCAVENRHEFEAFLEASIVFGRAAIHRLQSQFKGHPEWKDRFASLRGNPSVEFFRQQRDFMMKEAPPKVGQIIGGQPQRAAQMYYFDSPEAPATDTVRRHLEVMAKIVQDAEAAVLQTR